MSFCALTFTMDALKVYADEVVEPVALLGLILVITGFKDPVVVLLSAW